MPCAANALYTVVPGLRLEPPDGHLRRRGRGCWLHGLCGEVEHPDGGLSAMYV